MQRTKSVVGSTFVGAVAGSWLGYLFSQVSESGVSYAVIIMNLLLVVKYIRPAKVKEDSLTEQKQKKQQKRPCLLLFWHLSLAWSAALWAVPVAR